MDQTRSSPFGSRMDGLQQTPVLEPVFGASLLSVKEINLVALR